MPAARHCELALSRAQAGDCLGAGEHLAFCGGAQATHTRAAATRLCSAASANSTPPTLPPASPPPDQAPPAPPTTSAPHPPVTDRPPPSGSTPPGVVDPFQPGPAPTSTQPSSAVPPLHDDQPDRACDEAIAAAQRGQCGLAQAHLMKCQGAKQAAAQVMVRRKCPLLLQHK